MKRFKKALIITGVIVGMMILAHYFGLGKYLSLQTLKDNRGYLEGIVQENYAKAVLMYIGIYSAVISTALPGVPPLTIIGGFLFGFLPGGLYALVGAVIGTSLSFLLMRYVLSGLIRGKYAEKLEVFNEKIKSHGVGSYLLTMQLMGILPYVIINALAALADVPFITFFWTTAVGSIPIIFIYSFAGRQISLVESARDIFSPSIILLLLVFVLLSLMPLLFRFSRRVTDLR
jgi:uncharacterized membrane protein YdjX (TVP38/TMEM64 family)